MRVAIVLAHLAEIVAAAVTATFSILAATCGILPLGLGGQSELLAGNRIELLDELLTIIPADTLNRTKLGLVIRRIGAHHSLPEFLRHFKDAYGKTFNINLMHGLLVLQTKADRIHLCRGAHVEGASLYIVHNEVLAADGEHL